LRALESACKTQYKRGKITVILEKNLHPGDQTDAPMLFDKVELLDHFDGDEEFAQSILDDALTEIPKEVEGLIALCGGEDLQAIRLLAHTIKGMAANLCTNALRDIALKIETAAKNDDLESARGLLPKLEQTTRMTLGEIRKLT
jgi:HPt (histidine-containing phosphotransfer) domain-containing protein